MSEIYYIINVIVFMCSNGVEFKLEKVINQFIKFGVVGVSNTIVSYLINVFVLFIMKPMNVEWDFVVGNMIAFILSVLWSFYWNNRYTFKVEEGKSRKLGNTLFKMYISYGFTGIILNNVLSWFWLRTFGITKYFVPIMNIFISAPINFFMNKLWAFKAK